MTAGARPAGWRITARAWARAIAAWVLAGLIVGTMGCGARGGWLDGARAGKAVVLFDGASLEGWEQVGPGSFVLERDNTMRTEDGMGLLYWTRDRFTDFVLELEYRAESPGANSGIFLRFPEPPTSPWDAVEAGYEIQIDDVQRGDQVTGAVYGFAAPYRVASRPAGEWNEYRIRVTGQRYEVWLNGEKVNDFFGDRGREGYIGLQNHDPESRVAFRNVRVTPLGVPDAPERLGDLFTVAEDAAPLRVALVTATHGYRHDPAIDAAREVLAELSRTTELAVDEISDARALTAERLAGHDVLLLANATLRAAPRDPADSAAVEEARIDGVPDPLTPDQQDAVVEFVRSGGGLVVAHGGLAALYGWDEYRDMVGGGLFEEHPWTTHVRVDVEDPFNPATRHLGEGFWVHDEIYVLDRNPRRGAHVLLSLNMPSVGVPDGHASTARDDYPISWVRAEGEGRVFVTTLGHFADVWRNPRFAGHLLAGIRIAGRRLPSELGGRLVKETIAPDVWPDDLAVDERGAVWIAELSGGVHRWDPETGEVTEVGEVPTTDPTNIEHGLLGIEIDPDFYRGEPYIYLFYTEPEVFINTLSRFEVRDGRLDLATEHVLLRVPTEPACCHQAGDLEWGPDGTLFVSTGDTGQSSVRPTRELSEERIAAFLEREALTGYHWSRLTDAEATSQNLQSLRGKILRINRDGTIPKDNPFYGEPGVRWEIYAFGMRNPYRFKYDEPTGRLYIGVVGPDEQVGYGWYNVSRPGGGENFGWPRATGRLFYNEWTPDDIPGYVPPIWEYTYADGSRANMFGPVYRSEGEHALPDRFQGKLFIHDWSRRWIKYADLVNGVFESDAEESVRADERSFRIPALRLTNIRTFEVFERTNPISMDLGPDGCLYVAEFDGFWTAGEEANVSRYCWIPDRYPSQTTTGQPTDTRLVR